MLTHVVGECWHALERDVLALGYRTDDMFTTLSFRDMISIVVAAPPTSSVRWFLDGGWTRTDHLLANQQEQGAGVARLTEPYSRPGIENRQPEPPRGFLQADALPWEEAERRDEIRATGNFKHGPSRGRAMSALRAVG